MSRRSVLDKLVMFWRGRVAVLDRRVARAEALAVLVV
jgi:hypothetical protein